MKTVALFFFVASALVGAENTRAERAPGRRSVLVKVPYNNSRRPGWDRFDLRGRAGAGNTKIEHALKSFREKQMNGRDAFARVKETPTGTTKRTFKTIVVGGRLKAIQVFEKKIDTKFVDAKAFAETWTKDEAKKRLVKEVLRWHHYALDQRWEDVTSWMTLGKRQIPIALSVRGNNITIEASMTVGGKPVQVKITGQHVPAEGDKKAALTYQLAVTKAGKTRTSRLTPKKRLLDYKNILKIARGKRW